MSMHKASLLYCATGKPSLFQNTSDCSLYAYFSVMEGDGYVPVTLYQHSMQRHNLVSSEGVDKANNANLKIVHVLHAHPSEPIVDYLRQHNSMAILGLSGITWFDLTCIYGACHSKLYDSTAILQCIAALNRQKQANLTSELRSVHALPGHAYWLRIATSLTSLK